ncbi:mg499 protein [Tupanvirus deep ocean]|uniref:Mg499 protein n=2 Tax=Tupanvirus TaxID=2094720 RepID=A0AC62A878_9VIRU|nr:mg499 protein [Tupanvirus deep ocean]QKU33985.1 mg499 protein [Tupanvirus deep ocean]
MSTRSYSKLFGCNVHDAIRVSAMALKIINTPEFQRMRGIKQLGLCHHIYPAATHTRFEHSLGVYHLAGKMLEKIQQQYPHRLYEIPELGSGGKELTYKIAECIKIAALCHDIGHGPFSHIFDDTLLKNSTHPNRHHETRSCLIIEMLCKRELCHELDDDHIAFIKSIIDPQKHHKGALYQIVANHLNGIDVDKFDYLARDTKNLGLSTGFNANRLINEFIIDRNGNIAYPKHCSSDIYDMFHSRYMMHKKVYSHKTVKLVELMLADLFLKVDSIFGISSSINNMASFCKLTDDTIFHYIQAIMHPPSFVQINLDSKQLQAVKDANDIHQNIITRNLYQQVLEIAEDEKAEAYLSGFLEYLLKTHPNLNKDDFVIFKTKIGFVSGNKSDPFESIYFYDKKEDDNTFTVKKSHISGLISNKIQETHWHMVCKKRSIYHIVTSEVKNYTLSLINNENIVSYDNDEKNGMMINNDQ